MTAHPSDATWPPAFDCDARTTNDELRRHAEQNSVVANLGALALSGASLDFLLRHVASIVAEVLGLEFSEIVRTNPQNRFAFVQGIGWNNDVRDVETDAHSQVSLTLSARTPIVAHDISADERFVPSDFQLAHGIRSGLTVLIAGSGEPWGVLGVYSRAPRRFADSEIDFLRAVASILGQAIERSRVEIELRIRATQQSAIAELGRLAFRSVNQATLDRACELVQNGLGVEVARIFERNGDTTMDVRAASPPGQSHPWATQITADTQSGLAALTCAPVVVRDYATDERFPIPQVGDIEIRSGIAVPIASESSFVGVLSAFASMPRAFTQADVDFMESLAHTLSEAIVRERVQNERAELTRRLKLLLESTAEGLFAVDLAGRCTMLNRAAAAMLGRTPEELAGVNMHDVIHGPDDSKGRCVVRAVLESGEVQTFDDHVFRRSDGTLFRVDVSVAPILDDGRIVGAVATFEDITERLLLKAKLDQANRLSSLGRLSATVAHEFNNVLMGISPFVEVLRRTNSPEKIAMSLDHIGKSVSRGRRITQDILRFTQPARPVFGAVDVKQAIEALEVEARSILPPQYDLQIDVDALRVRADANLLHQIFMNLTLNARDAMPDGGVIRFEAHSEPAGATFPFGIVAEPQRFAHLVIADNGCGMSEETRRQALEPLFTTKKNGTGLGLAVTHQVVQQHSGEIFIESAPGAGTSFHIFLPLADS